MAASNEKPVGPFGGWFGTIGGLLGLFYGYDIAEWPGAIILCLIGAVAGLAVENVVFRILLILAGIIRFMMIQAFRDAIGL